MNSQRQVGLIILFKILHRLLYMRGRAVWGQEKCPFRKVNLDIRSRDLILKTMNIPQSFYFGYLECKILQNRIKPKPNQNLNARFDIMPSSNRDTHCVYISPTSKYRCNTTNKVIGIIIFEQFLNCIGIKVYLKNGK